MLLRLYPNAPGKPQFTVVNGAAATGYVVLNSIDWGNAAWDHAFSGPRGTQGARPSTGAPQMRVVTVPVKIDPTGSVDTFNLRQSVLFDVLEDMRRFGGKMLMQVTGQTYRQWLDVMTLGVARADWGRKGAIVDTGELDIVAQCAPYMLGDPMDTLDTFDTDTSADYTVDAGVGTIAVAGGVLDPSSTALKRLRHTAKGYSMADVQVALKITTGSTVTSGVWGVMARADTAAADTSIVAELVAGTNVIRVGKYIAGSFTSLATAAFTPAASTTYWIRLRLEGASVVAEVHTSAPTPASTATAQVAYTLTAAEAARFATGHAGIRVTPAAITETYDDFTVEPYTYRLWGMPIQLRLGGVIPGDVPALADIAITAEGGAATPIWGTAAWFERPPVHNLVWNGDFESSTIGTSGWVATAVAGVIGAATSVARDTTAARVKYGAGALQIVTPATTDTGASFRIFRQFFTGRRYAAIAWASSAAGTTNARIKLGVSGDVATGSSVALSATKTLYAVAWTPGAGWQSAYVAFGVAAATGTTMSIDGVCVVDSPIVALSAAQGSTSATAFTVYNTPTDVPNLLPDGTLAAPFLALIDTEIIRVTAIAAGGAWTADRGVEGTTAATHSADASVIILPPSRPQLEGKGAVPAIGLIEGEAYAPILSSAGAGSFATTVDANASGGNKLTWTPGTSGAQAASLVWMIDPSGLVPDDYTQGEIDVEVYVREAWAASLTNMKVTLSAQPEGGTTTGPERFTREFGTAGKLIQPASSKVSRPHRLGTLSLVVDPANPQRWRLKLALACTGGASPTWDVDHLLLLPTRARTPWPTGKANDTASAAAMQPAFIPYDVSWTTGSAMTKRLRSDGSSVVSPPGGYGYQDQGPGKPIEIPDVDCDFIVKLSPLVPDDPTLDSTGEAAATQGADVHFAITPRYALGRAS